MEFLPSATVLASFALAAIVLVITPGPDMTLFLSRALGQGRMAGMVSMLGAATGVVIHTLLAAFGISALIQASPAGFLVLKLVGALYLAWLAIDAMRNGSAFTIEQTDGPRASLWATWAKGVGINLLNPKVVLFFITFLPQFVTASDPQATAKMIVLGLLYGFLTVLICSAMVYAADRVSGALKKNPKITRAIDWVFAGIFSVFALRILLIDRG